MTWVSPVDEKLYSLRSIKTCQNTDCPSYDHKILNSEVLSKKPFLVKQNKNVVENDINSSRHNVGTLHNNFYVCSRWTFIHQ